MEAIKTTVQIGDEPTADEVRAVREEGWNLTPWDMVGGKHYVSTNLQPWDVIVSWQHPDQGPFEGYLWGNALKYLQRYRRKGKPVQDLEKAKHDIEQLLRELDNEHN